MTSLTNPVTGHQIETDDESVEFWGRAGYRAQQKPAGDKAASKKASSRKSSK